MTVTRADGSTLPVTIYADDTIKDCQDHAYGAPMIAFLIAHPCSEARRQLFTTTLNGRAVGVALEMASFPGPSPDQAYEYAAKFDALVQQDGTGNINDLMHEGYRLPSGPTKIPSSDAFAAITQDEGVAVFDLWYLSGSTPKNAPELVELAQTIFLLTF